MGGLAPTRSCSTATSWYAGHWGIAFQASRKRRRDTLARGCFRNGSTDTHGDESAHCKEAASCSSTANWSTRPEVACAESGGETNDVSLWLVGPSPSCVGGGALGSDVGALAPPLPSTLKGPRGGRGREGQSRRLPPDSRVPRFLRPVHAVVRLVSGTSCRPRHSTHLSVLRMVSLLVQHTGPIAISSETLS